MAQKAVAPQREPSTGNGSSKVWAEGALTRVLGVPLTRELRRYGIPESVPLEDQKRLDVVLKERFERTQDPVTGQIAYTWRPRSGRIELHDAPPSMRRASLAQRAPILIKDAIRALEAIESLKPTSDPDRISEIKSVIKDALNELLNELSEDFSTKRVELLFETLTSRGYGLLRGMKGLREIAGLGSRNVFTHEEEASLLNYWILRDHVMCLRRDWEMLVNEVDSEEQEDGGSLSFGTLARRVTEKASCARDVADRLIATIEDHGFQSECMDVDLSIDYLPGEPTTLGEFLRQTGDECDRWIAMVESNGRYGIMAIQPFASRQAELMETLIQGLVQKQKNKKLPDLLVAAIQPGSDPEELSASWILFIQLHDTIKEIAETARAVEELPSWEQEEDLETAG